MRVMMMMMIGLNPGPRARTVKPRWEWRPPQSINQHSAPNLIRIIMIFHNNLAIVSWLSNSEIFLILILPNKRSGYSCRQVSYSGQWNTPEGLAAWPTKWAPKWAPSEPLSEPHQRLLAARYEVPPGVPLSQLNCHTAIQTRQPGNKSESVVTGALMYICWLWLGYK